MIRTPLKSEIDKIVEFLNLHNLLDESTADLQSKRLRSLLCRSSSTVFIAETEQGLCGYAAVSLSASSPRVNVQSVYVINDGADRASDRADRAIETQLFAEIESLAKKRGKSRVRVTVRLVDMHLIVFLRRSKYQIVGSRSGRSDHDIGLLFLEKMLTSPSETAS